MFDKIHVERMKCEVMVLGENRLREYRKKHSITQEEFAKEMDVVSDYISMIERGARTPGFLLAKKIADYFNTTVDEIFFDDKSNKTFD